ncbi:MAG: substrate-binding domain-containing protein [SAR324 cluster bacterium]|nr:substrate-binding domain-containing protein [SAR324 cluster bacterium]
MAKECERWGRPVVMINRYVPEVHASWFCCANYEGGKMVAKLLLDANHQRPAFLAGSEDTTTSIDRERGFMEILNKEKVEALREIGEDTYQDAYDAAIRLLDRKDPPDAIFCANDIMALGVMDAAKNGLGLKIPEEVSIIGFDDILMSSWSSYSLTAVRQPIQRMVDASVEELLNRIENSEREPLQELIPVELVSVDPPACPLDSVRDGSFPRTVKSQNRSRRFDSLLWSFHNDRHAPRIEILIFLFNT